MNKFAKIFELPVYFRLAILLASVAGVIFAYYSLYFSEVQQQNSLLDEEISALEVDINKRRGIAANLGSYEKEVEKLNVELEKALQELPDKKGIEQLLARISDKARDSGLDVNLFRPEAEDLKEFYAEVPVQLEVTGTYHQLATFFDELSNLSRIVNVRDFRFKNPTKIRGEIELNSSVRVISFRFLEEYERIAAQEAAAAKG